MAGPTQHIVYTDDHGGAACSLKIPSWQVGITSDTAATTEPVCPHLTQRRHRFIRDSATGREYRVTVGDVGSAAWTAAKGAAVSGLTGISVKGLSGTTFSFQGRTGERDLVR